MIKLFINITNNTNIVLPYFQLHLLILLYTLTLYNIVVLLINDIYLQIHYIIHLFLTH